MRWVAVRGQATRRGSARLWRETSPPNGSARTLPRRTAPGPCDTQGLAWRAAAEKLARIDPEARRISGAATQLGSRGPGRARRAGRRLVSRHLLSAQKLDRRQRGQLEVASRPARLRVLRFEDAVSLEVRCGLEAPVPREGRDAGISSRAKRGVSRIRRRLPSKVEEGAPARPPAGRRCCPGIAAEECGTTPASIEHAGARSGCRLMRSLSARPPPNSAGKRRSSGRNPVSGALVADEGVEGAGDPEAVRRADEGRQRVSASAADQLTRRSSLGRGSRKARPRQTTRLSRWHRFVGRRLSRRNGADGSVIADMSSPTRPRPTHRIDGSGSTGNGSGGTTENLHASKLRRW